MPWLHRLVTLRVGPASEPHNAIREPTQETPGHKLTSYGRQNFTVSPQHCKYRATSDSSLVFSREVIQILLIAREASAICLEM